MEEQQKSKYYLFWESQKKEQTYLIVNKFSRFTLVAVKRDFLTDKAKERVYFTTNNHHMSLIVHSLPPITL